MARTKQTNRRTPLTEEQKAAKAARKNAAKERRAARVEHRKTLPPAMRNMNGKAFNDWFGLNANATHKDVRARAFIRDHWVTPAQVQGVVEKLQTARAAKNEVGCCLLPFFLFCVWSGAMEVLRATLGPSAAPCILADPIVLRPGAAERLRNVLRTEAPICRKDGPFRTLKKSTFHHYFPWSWKKTYETTRGTFVPWS